MKHNLLKSVILSVILLMGVSNAWAVNITGGTTLYLKPNSNWKSDGARFAAYFCNGSSAAEWYSMSDCNGDGIFEVTVSSEKSHANVIFCRMNGGNQTNDWNNKWNQTSDLTWDGTKNLCTITGWDNSSSWSSRSVTWYLTGDMNSWNTSSNQLTGSPLTQTIALSADKTYEFKIYNSDNCYFGNTGTMKRDNHSNWTMTHGETNCKITTDLQGNYKFAFDEATKKLTVTYPEECFLKGDFNDWSNTHSILGGSVIINLKAGAYEFKIHRYDQSAADYWCGNTGKMTRDNCSEWIMYDNQDDCTLQADFDGDYTFTYNRSTGKLSVTYPAAYKVTYDVGKNKGTTSVTTNPNIKSGSLALASTSITFSKDATIEGYTWKGWYSKNDGTGTNYGNGDTYTSTSRTADTSVYACYELKSYTITYNLNGGSGTMTPNSYNINTTAFNLPTPTKNGYTFAGWYDNEGLTGNKVTQVAKGSTGNKTYYAKWEATSYDITYNNLNGTTHTNPTTYTIETNTITFTAPSTRTGYTFAGWTPVSIAKGSTGDQTVTANWTANTYTITLDQQSGTDGTTSVTATYNSAMPAITIPTRNGYTFDGYFKNSDGTGTQYYNANGTSKTNWNIAENTTLYAKWTATNYTITYNTNGGNSIAQKNYTIETATFDLPTPTRTGYTFAGWYDNENPTGNKVTQVAKGSTGNKTFYAAWTINQYTLTYSAGEGGTVSGNHASGFTLDYNTSVTLTATPATGYSFTKWVDGSTELSTNTTYTFNITANKNIQAVFTQYNTIYLKPTTAWLENNARFAVYAWNSTGNTWANMEKVDCEGNYYKTELQPEYSTFNIVRLKAGSQNEWNNENVYNQTGNLTLPAKNNNMYDVADFSYIHLEPKAWDDGYARFAAYFYNNTSNEWVDLTLNESVKGSNNGKIYSGKIPQGKNYTHVIFCRMNINDPANNFSIYWHKTKDLAIMDNGDNCFWVNTDGDWNSNKEQTDGGWYRVWDNNQWKAFAPAYTITLDPFQYGEYGVIINGKTYKSHPTEEVVIENVTLGTSIQVIDAEANTPHYGHKLNQSEGRMYDCSVVVQPYDASTKSSIDASNNYTYIVDGSARFCANMVTTQARRVYLHIPTAHDAGWNKSGGNHNCVWVTEFLTNGNQDRPGALVELTKDENISGQGDGDYYYCDIPAGYNKFYFERKPDLGNSSSLSSTETFYYGIPLNNINCFTLTGTTNGKYIGSWGPTPTTVGDFRIQYIEQKVENSKVQGEEWKTIITQTYAHPSDVVKAHTEAGTYYDIVSLHIGRDATKNPEIILQKCTGATYNNSDPNNTRWEYTWEAIEPRMVMGPLTATADKAMLPGRKNSGSANPQLRYDNGIEVIKNDDKDGRVWNIKIQQTVDANSKITATLLLDEANLKPYEGNYYIRTSNADGGWSNYTIPENHITHSPYAESHSDFTHYFCKWVNIEGKSANVNCIIANDYGMAISQELTKDDFTNNDGNLTANANVRWSWNQYTNKVQRAYIAGSVKDSKYLTVTQAGSASTVTEFTDNGDWIYEADIIAKVNDNITKVTALYKTQEQNLVEKEIPLLKGDDSDNKYKIVVMYDFKINKVSTLLVPREEYGATTSIDVLIERTNHGQATQVKHAITKSSDIEGYQVYAALNFTKENGESAPYTAQRLYYWVSFPFDVRISDVFGFGEYGKHWIMQYYDGAARAANGAWADSPSYWRNITDTTVTPDNSTTLNRGILKANQGYVLALAKKIANMGIFENTNTVTLYFPSMRTVTEIDQKVIETAVTLDSYQCNINRPTHDGDRRIKDSHWHVLGVPSYSDHSQTLTQDDLMYFYQRDYTSADGYTVQSANGNTLALKSLHSYFVQYAGTINWAAEWKLNSPSEIAARKNVAAEDNYNLRLELQQNGANADQTFITLKDEDGITPMFDMNKDLTKIINSGVSVYTLIATDRDPIEVAGNVLPIANTVIPVGVQIATAGEYTFAMPDGTDGVVVELIDYEANITTNLLLSDYTVNLPAGANETRFALSVKPNKTATSVDNISGATGDEAKKYIIDGVLYLQRDGALYDAQGHIVR